ncbi:MAG: hypothetical protein GEU90_22240 [Gemmatimonas sp.]|nr:hypothetical protein [Gemmatimonas sp.]
MKGRPGTAFTAASVAVFAIVNAAAIALGPSEPRAILLLCGLAAVGFAMQSASWNRPALTSALVFSLPPVVGLIAGDPPIWLLGLLGTALLIAAELNALSWALRSGGPIDARRGLQHVGQLGVMGLAGSLGVGLVGLAPSLGGTTGVVVGASALAALGWVLFGRN